MLSQLCSMPEENWHKAERFQTDGQISWLCPTLKYPTTLCVCSTGTSHLCAVLQPSGLRTIPAGTETLHSTYASHFLLEKRSFSDTLDLFPVENFRINIKEQARSFLRDSRVSERLATDTRNDYSMWWIFLSSAV